MSVLARKLNNFHGSNHLQLFTCAYNWRPKTGVNYGYFYETNPWGWVRGQGHRPDRQTGRVGNRWTRDSAGWHVPSRADFIGHCPGNLHFLQAAEATLPSDHQFGSVGRAFGYQFSSLVWGLGFAPEQQSLFSSEANKMRSVSTHKIIVR